MSFKRPQCVSRFKICLAPSKRASAYHCTSILHITSPLFVSDPAEKIFDKWKKKKKNRQKIEMQQRTLVSPWPTYSACFHYDHDNQTNAYALSALTIIYKPMNYLFKMNW